MTRSTTTRRRAIATSGTALLAGTALALAGALPASAHVSVSASTTAAGSTALLSFTLPHSCDGVPTTALDIALPEEIIAATPTILAGWEIEKVTEAVASETTDSHGNEVSERVSHVVYTTTGDGVPEGYRAQFDIQVSLPHLDAGTELGFPVVQICGDEQVVWDGDSLPTITLTEAAADDGHGHAHGDETHDDDQAAAPTDAPSGDDVLARVLGVAGLVVGAIGIVLGVTGRRRTTA